VISYYSLASGFLSGKYRVESDLAKSVRGNARVKEGYFNEKGLRIIKALDLVSKEIHAPIASVALAWVLSNPSITAPIASATNPDQLKELIRGTELKLNSAVLKVLNEAGS
jgi:aryl-alcohol dehydrogenase-like predicted oxidoreductase